MVKGGHAMRGEVRAGRREGVGLRRRKRRARGGPGRGRGIGKLGGGSLEAVAGGCRAAQSRQARPEEVREPSWGAAKGGDFDRAAVQRDLGGQETLVRLVRVRRRRRRRRRLRRRLELGLRLRLRLRLRASVRVRMMFGAPGTATPSVRGGARRGPARPPPVPPGHLGEEHGVGLQSDLQEPHHAVEDEHAPLRRPEPHGVAQAEKGHGRTREKAEEAWNRDEASARVQAECTGERESGGVAHAPLHRWTDIVGRCRRSDARHDEVARRRHDADRSVPPPHRLNLYCSEVADQSQARHHAPKQRASSKPLIDDRASVPQGALALDVLGQSRSGERWRLAGPVEEHTGGLDGPGGLSAATGWLLVAVCARRKGHRPASSRLVHFFCVLFHGPKPAKEVASSK
eukprot:scaffold104588_cov62-Phaeocystis_antarctica.AAC.3